MVIKVGRSSFFFVKKHYITTTHIRPNDERIISSSTQRCIIRSKKTTSCAFNPDEGGIQNFFFPPHQKAPKSPPVPKSLSEFIEHRKDVTDVHVDTRTHQLVYYDDNLDEWNSTHYVDTSEFWTILLHEDQMNVNIQANETTNLLSMVISAIFMFSVFRLIFSALLSNMYGGSTSLLMNNREVESRKMNVETNITTRFCDVQGIDNAKEELEEIVDFLKNPEKYVACGAKIPRGALLYGRPGTGKTLLARAIAGESCVPFIQCSGSSFIEMFVGVGAKRVREIFEYARTQQPCVIFIDEIDAIGKQRSNGFQSNDEREQTIIQLLTEMDGFDNTSQIVVIGATNRLDILDDALIRPGRFDRRIEISVPSTQGREKILKVHSQNKRLAEDVSLKTIAAYTNGFSGADLANLMNESAIRAVLSTETGHITSEIIENTFQRMVIGAKGERSFSDETKKRIAYHEAGHAIVGALMVDYDQVRKVSIIPRGNAGGTTFFQSSEDVVMYTKESFRSQIQVALGGYVAEEIIFGEKNVSVGASGDFQKVYTIATDMVVRYGFGIQMGKMSLTSENNNNLSGRTKYMVEQEIKTIVDECYEQTFNLLHQYKWSLHELVELLMERDVVDGLEVYRMLAKVHANRNMTH
jgi:cell division protease FtsH